MDRTLTLSLTLDQMAALKRGNALRICECQEMIAALVQTHNDKTELADFWRRQLAAATALQMQVREVS